MSTQRGTLQLQPQYKNGLPKFDTPDRFTNAMVCPHKHPLSSALWMKSPRAEGTAVRHPSRGLGC